MKRKSIALLLALTMCLATLSACGANNTPETSEPPSSESTAQPTADEKEEQPTQEPEQEETEETTPESTEEPTQEESEPENNAGTVFLALLQEEYQSGFFEGEGPNHTYYTKVGIDRKAFIYNGVVYLSNVKGYGDFCSYDIDSKEIHEAVSFSENITGTWNPAYYFVDGNFYIANCGFEARVPETRIYNCNGELLTSFQHDDFVNYSHCFFEKGILAKDEYNDNNSAILLSYELEKKADIPAPQREVEQGEKKDFELNSVNMFAADGTVCTKVFDKGSSYLYRFNTDTYEWESLGELNLSDVAAFCGKYISSRDGIYDRITGEQVFEYGELYHAANSKDGLCYFGGDKYLGNNGNEYRWVSLTDLSMSDPLPFPEGKTVTVLNDTYCVYEDSSGWFLWDYNTGIEETIVMYEN